MTTFEDEWQRCAGWLRAALDHAANTHDLGHVEAMVRAGEAQFWPGKNSAAVSQITEHPNFKAFHIWLVGGDLAELTDEMRPRAEAWARTVQGVTRVTVLGRPGWEKVLAPLGYASPSRLLVKEMI